MYVSLTQSNKTTKVSSSFLQKQTVYQLPFVPTYVRAGKEDLHCFIFAEYAV